jgi:hypothetical protein
MEIPAPADRSSMNPLVPDFALVIPIPSHRSVSVRSGGGGGRASTVASGDNATDEDGLSDNSRSKEHADQVDHDDWLSKLHNVPLRNDV